MASIESIGLNFNHIVCLRINPSWSWHVFSSHLNHPWRSSIQSNIQHPRDTLHSRYSSRSHDYSVLLFAINYHPILLFTLCSVWRWGLAVLIQGIAPTLPDTMWLHIIHCCSFSVTSLRRLITCRRRDFLGQYSKLETAYYLFNLMCKKTDELK